MEEEISLLDYWRVIVKWRRLLLQAVALVTFSSVLISLFMTKTFRAEASLMPIGGGPKGGGLAMAVAQMGLGGILGNVGGVNSSSPQILAMLNSRTLAERIIDKFDLKKVLYPKLWDEMNQKWTISEAQLPPMEDIVKSLHSKVTFTEDKKNQVILIRAELKDPRLAASVVNGYLEALEAFINENTFTAAKRNRIFIEGQLERNKAELLQSGKELSSFYESNKISNVVPAVDVNVSMVEAASGNRQGRNGENSGMRIEVSGEREAPTADSGGAPWIANAFADVQKKSEMVQKKLENVESQLQKARVVKEVPQQVYLEYLTLRRGLLNQVNGLLTQQYEMAKIEESKEELTFQVIDKARVPVKKYKPKRVQIVLTTFVISLFMACFYAFFREYLEKMKVLSASRPSA